MIKVPSQQSKKSRIAINGMVKAGEDFYAAEPELIKYKEFMDDRSLFKDVSEFDEELIRSGFSPLSKPTKAK